MIVWILLAVALVGYPPCHTLPCSEVYVWRSEGLHTTRVATWSLPGGLTLRSDSPCHPEKECGIPAGDGWREMLERITRIRQMLHSLKEHFGKTDKESKAFKRMLLLALLRGLKQCSPACHAPCPGHWEMARTQEPWHGREKYMETFSENCGARETEKHR